MILFILMSSPFFDILKKTAKKKKERQSKKKVQHTQMFTVAQKDNNLKFKIL